MTITEYLKMTNYYLIETYNRSTNACTDGSVEIKQFYLTIDNPDDDRNFDRYISSSESLITEFEADSEEVANKKFHEYMSENYDCSNSFAKDDFENPDEIANLSLGREPFENEFYSIADPDGVSGREQGIYPEATEGTVTLYGLDTGTHDRVNSCIWFYDFLQIPEFKKYLTELADLDPNDEYEEGFDPVDYENDIDWDSIGNGSNEIEKIIEILEANGYSTCKCSSAGHLDSSSPGGCGGGNVYVYVFIRKNDCEL